MSYQKQTWRGHIGAAVAIGGAAILLIASTAALAAPELKDSYVELEHMEFLSTDVSAGGSLLGSTPIQNSSGPYLLGFQGPTQYDAASFSRNFIPPDTMGAVGKTQYVATTNGAYGIYDKATGAQLSMVSDVAFWAAAGQTGANGDTRILYNAAASRWVAVSFGASVSDLQIAVSATDNALGPWQSVKFTGFAGGVADYPTLAIDTNAVYIGTNNFKVGCLPGPGETFCGTTLNVIPVVSLFGGGAPTVTNMKQFVTPYVAGSPSNVDRGFAQQGVMGNPPSGTATIVANSVLIGDNITFKVNGLTPSDATAATLTASTYLGVSPLIDAGPARQPAAAVPGNRRVIDALDQRISSSVYEAGGRIYMVQTVDGGSDYARLRYTIIDAATNAILDQGDIGSGNYDYYQGSIAVNSNGDVVIGYNRSGLDPATGKIGFYVRTFLTNAGGKLVPTGSEILLHESLTDDYHNGSIIGQVALGRQRWGDYSQVSIDPDNSDLFWLIGEFALEYNYPPDHDGGTGGSRWGTWIASIDVSGLSAVVPEPATWLLLIFGFGSMVLIRIHRRRSAVCPLAV